MSSLFSTNIPVRDSKYLEVRDNSEFRNEKDYLEHLWITYESYADPDFKVRLAQEFHPRFWEMYLGCTLLHWGLALCPKTNSKGPDIQVKAADGSTTWLEAVAPGPGEGPDAVPDHHPPGERPRVPEEKILLRFTNAILSKKDRYANYIQEGIVASTDSCVIAINGGQIPFAIFDGWPHPFILNPLLAIGKPFITVDTDQNKIIDQGFHSRLEISKESGASVSTSIFLDDEYVNISAVIYSRVHWRNHPENPGGDFIFVHNPKALSPMTNGWPQRGKEYWVEGPNLQSRVIS